MNAPVRVDAPVTFEEMVSLVRAERIARMELRRLMRAEGSLQGRIVDRRLMVLARLELFLTRCMVRRGEVVELMRGVAVPPLDGWDAEA